MIRGTTTDDSAPAGRAIEGRIRNRWIAGAALGIYLLSALFYVDRLRVIDHDLHWHMVLGREIVSRQRVVIGDPMSFTRAGEPYVGDQWLSEVSLHLLHGIGNGAGLLMFRGAVVIGIALALLGAAGGHRSWTAYPPALAALFVLRKYLLFRPRIVSLLFLALLVVAERRGIRRVWLLPVVFFVWVNFHPAFPLGMAFLAAAWIGRLLDGGDRGRFAERVGVLGLSVLATLLSPFGWRVWTSFVDLAGDRLYPTSEWQRLWSYPLSSTYFLHLAVAWVWILGVPAVLVAMRMRPPWSVLLPFGCFAGLAVWMVRFVPAFALVATPMIAHVYREIRARPLVARSSMARAGPVVASALLIGWMLLRGPGPWAPPRASPDEFPVGIVEQLRDRGVGGNVLNSWGWAGYLVWAGSDLRIFIDPRTAEQLYPVELFEDWERLVQAREGWRELLDRYPIDLVIVSRSEPIADRLAVDGNWELLVEDPAGVCYARKTPASSERTAHA